MASENECPVCFGPCAKLSVTCCEEEEIVFCCEGCNRAIIRDSKEHDLCNTRDGEIWYCMDCKLPSEKEEEEEEEESDEEDEDEAIGNCCEWCEEDTIFFADSHCIDCQNDAASTISKAFKAFKCKKEEEEEESDDPFKGCDECGDWGNGYGISLYQKGKYWYCSGCMEIMDGCTYNFYICRHCFAFGTDNPDCHKCKREMCVLLYQEKNAKLALAKAKQD